MTLPERLREYRQTLDRDVIAGLEAERFLTYMQLAHPDELAEWLATKKVQFITAEFARQERADRKAALDAAIRAAFIGGDAEGLGLFRAAAFVIDDSAVRRPLGQMTEPDLLYAANWYERNGNHALEMAGFLRALAERVGDQPVASVMDEKACGSLLADYVGSGALA